MIEFLIKLVVSAVLTVVIHVVTQAVDFDLHWAWCALASLVIVFGGWFIASDADGDWGTWP